jgi:hypothetical protein
MHRAAVQVEQVGIIHPVRPVPITSQGQIALGRDEPHEVAAPARFLKMLPSRAVGGATGGVRAAVFWAAVTQRIEWSQAVYATVPGDEWLLATSGFCRARSYGLRNTAPTPLYTV